MPTYQFALLLTSAYLLGSIPTSYIAGRLIKGIDIRRYGSGSASSTNVWHSVSRKAMVAVVIADMLKGLIPVAIASHLLNFPVWAQGTLGLAAITGHSWSIFLGFSGGRGWATMIGFLLIFGRWELLTLSIVGLSIFALIKNSPLSMFLAIVSMPIASLALASYGIVGFDRGLILLCICLLILLKRILAERPVPRSELAKVLIYRLILDRDTRNRESWIYRKPNDLSQS